MVRQRRAHQAIQSRRVPRPAGHAAQAVLVTAPGPQLFVGLLLPHQMPRGQLVTQNAKLAAELVLGHLRDIVQEAHFSLDEVVSLTLFLVEMSDLAVFDKLLPTVFVGLPLPARCVVQVGAMEGGSRMGLTAIAVRAATPTAAGPALAAPGGEEEEYL